jgi:hypothetical protein
MLNHWAIIALDIAAERTREADRQRLAALYRAGRVNSPSRLRRISALTVAAISRGLAGLTRRLDGRVADELADTLHSDRLATSH